MSAAAIDANVLNSLFENQKRLDDVFNSIFDNDNFFIASSSWQSDRVCPAPVAVLTTPLQQDRIRKSLLAVKEQHPYIFLLPIMMEIAAIYLVIDNFL